MHNPGRGNSSSKSISMDCKQGKLLNQPKRHRVCIHENCECDCHAGQEYVRGHWRPVKEKADEQVPAG